MYTADSALLGAPQATREQAITFIERRTTGEYDHAAIAEIVGGYWTICTKAGADPVVLLAQLCHETESLSSWWAARPRRNPAGIGVTGQKRTRPPTSGVWQQQSTSVWAEGVAFAGWVDRAIPAHVGRMLAYGFRDQDLTAAQRALVAYALKVRALPASYRGVAPTLRGLAGRWAVPGQGYPFAIANMANAITKV